MRFKLCFKGAACTLVNNTNNTTNTRLPTNTNNAKNDILNHYIILYIKVR